MALQGGGLRVLALAVALTGTSAGAGFANPQGGTVVSGGASIGRPGKSLTVKQTTDRAIINWRSFSTGTGETTRFVQPSVASAILNRVTGGDPSVLLGRLQSNGQVYLINPNGIMVGPNGVIDTRGGFVASTLDVPGAAFERGGSLTFSGGSTATISNLGTIKTTNGNVALIALHVVNGGSISAPDGQALLAGGNEVLYVPDGDSSVVIRPGRAPGGATVDNSGRIAAASAQLKAAGSPYALAVNNTGAVEATGLTAVGGRLMLSGGDGDVESGGTLAAPGGTATLTGGRVAVTGSVDVTAPMGGGRIAVQGTNAAVVTPTGSLAANATQNGNGGHISVTSRGATNFAGTASATGGPRGGNGGTAEISGRTLGVTGTVALKAPKGKAGSLLFDPDEIDVEPGTASPGDIIGGIWSFSQDAGAQTIGTTTIVNLLASGNLALQATTGITINGAISATSANTLEFDSPTITVNQPITITGGNLVFSGINGSQPAVAGQSLTTAVSATLSANTIGINSFATATLGGAVQATQLALDNPFLLLSGPVSITATNAANAVGTLSLDGLDLSGALTFSTSGSLSVGGQASAGSMAITAAGDLTMSAQGNVQLAGKNGGPITLASTGGAFIDQVGSNLFFPTTGREVIYSATDSGNFSAVGLGFPQYNPVAFGSDPESSLSQVIYIANSTALAPLAITADTLSRTYGATGPNFTFNNGDSGLASLAIQPQFALLQDSTPVTNGTGLAAGTYTIVPSGAISSNNALSFTNGTFTVNPAPLNIVANNATISFGDSLPTLTAGIFGLVNSDPTSIVTGLSIATTATNGSGVGNYPITPSGASAPNYTITFTPGTLTIGKAALTLTITADDLSRLYGAANPTLTASYAGFVNGDDSSVVSGLVLSTTAIPTSPVGIYPIIASGASAANYNVALVNGTLTVTPAPLTITANNNTRLYGGIDPTFAAGFAGLVNGEDSSVVSGLQFSTNATSASPVGNGYTITPFGASASNYSISYATGALSVTPAPLLITANDASKTYGAANPPLSASFTGLVNGEGSSVVSGLQFGTPATSASGIGNYTITPSSASAGNYSITYAAGTLSVTPAPLLITVNDAARIYGAANPDFIPSISGFVNGDGPSAVSGLQLATTATSLSNIGAYPITGSSATAANYAISYVPGTLTVNRAPLTITANDASSVYAQSFPSFGAGYAGLVNGDPQSVVTGLQFVANGIQGSPVGTYSIIPFGATATNYSISFANGTLNITPAPLTITADNTSRLYGAANPAFTASYAGLVNSDTSSVITGLQLATAATSASNAGAYPIAGSGAVASNYTIAYVNGTLTVNPAPLLITANNASSVYGAAIPGFGASYSGFVNGDNSSVVSGLAFSPPPSPANAGAHAIVPSGATAANYAIGYRNGTLTITPASLTIGPDGTQTYGGTPTVTFVYSRFVNGDTAASLTTQPTFTTPAGQFDSVNFYPLFASGAASPNYTISYQPGTLRITPATVFVTPADVTRLFGAATAPDSVFFSGFVNGDSASSVFSTVPIANSDSPLLNVGKYPLPVYQGGVIKNPNYVEADLTGTLTVKPAPLTITGLNASGTQGQPLPTLTGQFAGLVNGETPQTVNFTFGAIVTGGNIVTSSSPTGSYQTVVIGNDPNYIVTFIPGTLNLDPPPIVIATKLTPTDLSGLNLSGADAPITVYTTDPLGFAAGDALASSLAYQEEQSVIDQFLAATGDSLAAVQLALKNPGTAAAMLGDLTPFLYADLQSILNIDQSQWTAQQTAFVQAFQNYIQAQKEAAANQAMADYQSWKEQQTAIYNAKVSAVSGIAQMDEMAILSSDPPIPPPDFLNEAQSGMNLTNVDVLNVSVIAGQTAQISQDATNVQYNMSLAAVNFFLQNYTDPSNQKLFNQLKTELSSKDIDVQASAEQYLMNQYSSLVQVGQAPDMPPGYSVASEQSATGFIGGAIGDGTIIVSKMIMAGTSVVLKVAADKGVTTKPIDLNLVGKDSKIAATTEYLNSQRLPKYQKQLQAAIDALQKALEDPDLTEIKAQIKQTFTDQDGKVVLSDYQIDQRAQAKIDDMKQSIQDLKTKVENVGGEVKGIEGAEGVIKETQSVDDMLEVSKTLQSLAKGAEALGAVTGPVGVVIEVAANIAQIITGGVEYGTLDTYNTAFNNAVNAAKQPVSVNDLKAMLNSDDGKTQMLNYFETMMATGGQASGAAPTMSLSQIEAH
ncbi:MAG TPA: MBG domain-containing protein [Stellaceae bacterium]|nr:MBG domain-containing protein [Stellaceae bacterium]